MSARPAPFLGCAQNVKTNTWAFIPAHFISPSPLTFTNRRSYREQRQTRYSPVVQLRAEQPKGSRNLFFSSAKFRYNSPPPNSHHLYHESVEGISTTPWYAVEANCFNSRICICFELLPRREGR
ncbi:unnamed protein product [Linum tenue]|uniref:Uncharacterized protein n=1 Tax=Linum tenue TaxID=586396 RepID=A0AAV0ID45_9ROSI|nr:unnamed protein product [Linum tenue]